jgi:hypothetical protein
MINTIVEAGSVGAGDASRYGSGSDQMMRLRFRNTAHEYNLFNAFKYDNFPNILKKFLITWSKNVENMFSKDSKVKKCFKDAVLQDFRHLVFFVIHFHLDP